MNPELKKLAEEINSTFDAVKADHERRLSDLETKQARSANYQAGRFEFSQIKSAVSDVLRKGVVGPDNAKAWEATGADADGAVALPEQLGRELVELMREFNPFRREAGSVEVKTSDFKQIVIADGAQTAWVAEADARPETDAPAMAEVPIPAGEMYANPGISQQALDDLAFDVYRWFVEHLARRFAEAEGEAFIVGTGTNQPKGILTYQTAATGDASRAFGTVEHIATGQAAALPSSDDAVVNMLIDIQYKLQAGYRANAKWLMSSELLASIRKLVDSENRHIWTPGLAEGQPSMLLGHPVVEMSSMPSVAANALPIVFGDFRRAYLIADRMDVRLLRDPFTRKPFVHLYCTKRVGGALVDSAALKVVKVASS